MIARFLSAADATQYRDACNAAEGLPRPGVPEAPYPYGWTLSWADVVQDADGKWPIFVHEDVPVPDGIEVISDSSIF